MVLLVFARSPVGGLPLVSRWSPATPRGRPKRPFSETVAGRTRAVALRWLRSPATPRGRPKRPFSETVTNRTRAVVLRWQGSPAAPRGRPKRAQNRKGPGEMGLPTRGKAHSCVKRTRDVGLRWPGSTGRPPAPGRGRTGDRRAAGEAPANSRTPSFFCEK